MKVVCKVAFALTVDELEILKRANEVIYDMFIAAPNDTHEESLLREAGSALNVVLEMIDKQASYESEDV